MRLINLTETSMGWNNPFQTRTLNQIRNIGIHHSATNQGSQSIFENHWRNLGWRNGGYSEVILQNGDVEICYNPTTVTNGVGGHNLNTYHICVVGNSNFTVEQEQSLLKRIEFNMGRFQIAIARVLGHNEFAGHSSNICPGRNMNILRSNLKIPSIINPTLNANAEYMVQHGDTLWSIATENYTTVKTLMNLNALKNTIIYPEQVLQLPDETSHQKIDVGARVRVNRNAERWVTGQSIPLWVHGQIYTIQQVRHNGNELLLANVMSWIHRKDVTLV